MRAKMVRPIALRLTLAESKLLDAWIAKRKGAGADVSASDVIRHALVVAGLQILGREEWTRLAKEGRTIDEWTDRLGSAPGGWGDLDARIDGAPGSDDDRKELRARIGRAIDDVLLEHATIHSCQRCGSAVNGDDLKAGRECPTCGAVVGAIEEADVPF